MKKPTIDTEKKIDLLKTAAQDQTFVVQFRISTQQLSDIEQGKETFVEWKKIPLTVKLNLNEVLFHCNKCGIIIDEEEFELGHGTCATCCEL